MNANIFIRLMNYIPVGILSFLLLSCERELDDLSPVTYPANPECI